MPTADDLYLAILKFLARGTNLNSPEGPHDLASGANTPEAPGWGYPKPLQGVNNELLPACTLGKGEMSVPPLLAQHLGSNYLVIAEFCLADSLAVRSSARADLFVMDKQRAPIAVIEFKHFSVHQGSLDGLFDSMNDDYDDRIRCKTVHWPSAARELECQNIGSAGIPIIQIGLLTTVSSPYRPPPRACLHPAGFFRYVERDDLAGSSNALAGATIPGATAAKNALARYKEFGSDAREWWRSKAPNYRLGNWGWGPEESYSLFNGSAPDFPVVGRVGYVCVMT